jgi:protein TonB
VLPPVETPPPPITSQDFPKAQPKQAAPPKPQPPAPTQQAHTAPAPSQQQRLAPSPLSQHQSPTQQATAPTTTFINPADTYVHTKARDDYLWMVLGKFSQYLPKLFQSNQGGTVVLSFSIGRDGRLIDASIIKSSGVIALDRGLLEALRAASPYPPLPSEIPGDRVSYTQPITARQ